MATAVIMPRQGQSVESCIIGTWYKKVGDKVAIGDELFSYETDKAAFDEEARVEGEMLAILHAEGVDVPCLSTVCVIGAKGEDISAFLAPSGSAAAPAQSTAAAETSKTSTSAPPAADAGNASVSLPPQAAPADTAALAISPRARALASKHHADLRAVRPSGPNGRVIERDVRALIEAGHYATGAAGSDYRVDLVGTGIGGRVSVADVEASAKPTSPAPVTQTAAPARFIEEKHSNIRKLIARSMSASLSSMAQLTYTASFDASRIIDFRAQLKAAKEAGLVDPARLDQASITINDIILFAVSRVVKQHRVCNASFLEDRMVFFTDVNIGMAVDTPRGLMVPTIFGADRMSLGEISASAKRLAADCQKGTISPDLLKDGTITVTNLGGLGIESFTPVVNPPQTTILGVNRLTTSVRAEGGVAVPYPSMSLSLTCDHRAVDGAPAARFLKDLTAALENLSLLLTQ